MPPSLSGGPDLHVQNEELMCRVMFLEAENQWLWQVYDRLEMTLQQIYSMGLRSLAVAHSDQLSPSGPQPE